MLKIKEDGQVFVGDVKHILRKEIAHAREMYEWSLEEEKIGRKGLNNYLDHCVAIQNVYKAMFGELI